jgi:hypothetical protein
MIIRVRDLKEFSFYYLEWEWLHPDFEITGSTNYFKGICLYFRGELHDINSSDSWCPSTDRYEIKLLEEI